MIENILLIVVLIMMIYVIFIFMNWIKDIFQIIFKITNVYKKPQIHLINGSWEDLGKNPFEVFSSIESIKIGDVVFCKSGSWKGIYWQKVTAEDWTTSAELQKTCKGDLKIFNNWIIKNENLKKPIN